MMFLGGEGIYLRKKKRYRATIEKAFFSLVNTKKWKERYKINTIKQYDILINTCAKMYCIEK